MQNNTIPEKYTGTWDDAKYPGCFVINSDGSGKVFMLGISVPCSYQFSGEGGNEKLTLITTGSGECVYDCNIDAQGKLKLSNPAPDAKGAAAGLPVYATMFGPYAKAG